MLSFVFKGTVVPWEEGYMLSVEGSRERTLLSILC